MQTAILSASSKSTYKKIIFLKKEQIIVTK